MFRTSDIFTLGVSYLSCIMNQFTNAKIVYFYSFSCNYYLFNPILIKLLNENIFWMKNCISRQQLCIISFSWIWNDFLNFLKYDACIRLHYNAFMFKGFTPYINLVKITFNFGSGYNVDSVLSKRFRHNVT